VSLQSGRGPGVIDTDVYGAELVPGSGLAERYQLIIVGRPAFISFQTAAELRYGALLQNWGEGRIRKLEARIAAAETVHTGPELVLTYAPPAGRVPSDRTSSCSAGSRRRPLGGCNGRSARDSSRVQRRHLRERPRPRGGNRCDVASTLLNYLTGSERYPVGIADSERSVSAGITEVLRPSASDSVCRTQGVSAVRAWQLQRLVWLLRATWSCVVLGWWAQSRC